mgnify:CR=1 FL=1
MTPGTFIAVVGPSGVGKGTISHLLAERLGWHLLDSGALYRVTGQACLIEGAAHSAFSHGRAANVSKADEKDAFHEKFR